MQCNGIHLTHINVSGLYKDNHHMKKYGKRMETDQIVDFYKPYSSILLAVIFLFFLSRVLRDIPGHLI